MFSCLWIAYGELVLIGFMFSWLIYTIMFHFILSVVFVKNIFCYVNLARTKELEAIEYKYVRAQ